jgi:hypothetical protein
MDFIVGLPRTSRGYNLIWVIVDRLTKSTHYIPVSTTYRVRQYADKRRGPLKFDVGDHVYLRVSPMKGVRRFSIKGKLAPRYISLYSIIDKYGPTSYQVELPARLLGVHNVFYVSQLKRCLNPPTDVAIEDTIPLEPDLTYRAYPTKILD